MTEEPKDTAEFYRLLGSVPPDGHSRILDVYEGEAPITCTAVGGEVVLMLSNRHHFGLRFKEPSLSMQVGLSLLVAGHDAAKTHDEGLIAAVRSEALLAAARRLDLAGATPEMIAALMSPIEEP